MPLARLEDPLTAEQLRALLDYDPFSGAFIWKRRPRGLFPDNRAWNTWNSRYAGTAAGTSTKPYGYIQIGINGTLYLGQRLAWLWMTGRHPELEVDHADTNTANNRWGNLRHATSSQGSMNTRVRSDNTSGYKGVWRDKRRGKWVAEIMIDSKKRHLGYYDTAIEAHLARMKAATRLHGEFARFA